MCGVLLLGKVYIIMIIARRTESVNEGVINAAVNCSHIGPTSGQSDTSNPSNCKMSAIFFFVRRVCNHLSTTCDQL